MNQEISIKITKMWRPTNHPVLLYADLLFFDILEVRGWRLVKSKEDGYFIGYPNSPIGNGKMIRQVIPRTEELQEAIKKLIVEAYERMGAK